MENHHRQWKRNILKRRGSIALTRTAAKEWNRKKGVLLGLKTDFASLKACKEELKEHRKTDSSYFEFKKKVEREREIEAQCTVVQAIDTKAEEERKGELLLNRLQNIAMGYVIIKRFKVK